MITALKAPVFKSSVMIIDSSVKPSILTGMPFFSDCVPVPSSQNVDLLLNSWASFSAGMLVVR
jgi:hypothetical protein